MRGDQLMQQSENGPATSPAGPSGRAVERCEWCNMRRHRTPAQCPFITERDPVQRGLFLAELLSELAQLRHATTITYADAFLLAPGTDAQRTQHAKRAAADDHLAAEQAAARVAGYRHMIGVSDATS